MYVYKVERETTKELRLLGKEFINQYHSYIKWSDRPSRKLYWNLYENEKMVGVFALGSAFAKPMVIKEFMQKNRIGFNEMANNIVFCLFGQENKNAGSSLLALVRRDAKVWWMERYGDCLKCFQTFILPPRTGAVYKADNWIALGMTSGKSQQARTIKRSDYEKDPEKYELAGIEIRQFKNGETRYIVREFSKTEQKIIFVKIA